MGFFFFIFRGEFSYGGFFFNVNGFHWIFIGFVITLPSDLVQPCPTSVTLSVSFSSVISLALFFRLCHTFFYFTLRFVFLLYLFAYNCSRY